MKRISSDYQAYLLRLWQVDDGATALWRTSLQDVHTGQRRGFADLDKAFAFLRERISAGPTTRSSNGSGIGDQDHTSEEPSSSM